MKPILFNADMVRAILDGRKTVTRRVVKPQPNSKLAYACMGYKHGTWGYPDKNAWKYWDDESYKRPDGIAQEELEHRWTPPCHTGDILYVRETFCRFDPDHIVDGNKYAYYADATPESERIRKEYGYKWSPSIHMTKEAARLFLRVTDVRVERLRDITDDGAIAEGIYQVAADVFINGGKWTYERSPAIGHVWSDGPRYCFGCGLWAATIKRTDLQLYGWKANPWVWVIEFKRISKEAAYANDVEIFAP